MPTAVLSGHPGRPRAGLTAALGVAAIQLCHPDVSQRHPFALVFGSMLWFILGTPLHEFAPAADPAPARGMLVVGFVATGLLVLLRFRLRRAPRVASCDGH